MSPDNQYNYKQFLANSKITRGLIDIFQDNIISVSPDNPRKNNDFF